MAIRVGTRGSALALAQTELVVQALRESDSELDFSVRDIKTIGDCKQGTPRASHGDKKDWIYELELAILSREIDFAVHSGKDVPNDIEPGTTILPVLPRSTPYDVFIGKLRPDGSRVQFDQLPTGASIGTASLRRRASLLRLRPDLNVVEHRGNVTTRLSKLDESETLSGIVLAAAGLERLNLARPDYYTFDVDEMVPALNQGCLLIQYAVDRIDLTDVFLPIVDKSTYDCWTAERAVVERIQGDCKTSMGVYASHQANRISLVAQVMLPDGSDAVRVSHEGATTDPRALGLTVAEELLARGAGELLERSRGY